MSSHPTHIQTALCAPFDGQSARNQPIDAGHGDLSTLWRAFRDAMPIADEIAYFDHAAVGPLFGPGAAAMRAFIDQAANVGDMVWPSWNQTLEQVRSATATMLDCDSAATLTIANTTTGINLVAEGLDWREGDNVVLPAGEFPSNLFPWLNQKRRGVEVRTVPWRDGHIQIDDLIDACDARTRIISVSWVAYATGFRINIDELVHRAHQKNVLVFLDGIQGLGIYPLSIAQTPVDFVAADGHKWLLGPEGFGVMMIAPQHFDRLQATNVGWASVKDSHNYTHPKFDLRDSATRFESGSANMLAASGLSKSLEFFNQVAAVRGPRAMSERIIDQANALTDRLRSAGAVVNRPSSPHQQSGIVQFQVNGVSPAKIRQIGMERGVVTSCRGGGVRAAVHAYNYDEDIDRLVKVVVDCQRYPNRHESETTSRSEIL